MQILEPPPRIELSEEQKFILAHFPVHVELWKNFLIDLGFFPVTIDTVKPEPSLQLQESYINFNPDMEFDSFTPIADALDKGLILTAGGFVAAEQFLDGKYRPAAYEDDVPPYLQFSILTHSKAEIYYNCGDAIHKPLFDVEKYFGETSTSIEGSHAECAKIIMAIKREILDNLHIAAPPQVSTPGFDDNAG